MAYFRPDDIEDFGTRLMCAAGAPDDEAAIIAMHCVASLRSGEQLHGMDLGTSYIPLIRDGVLKPGAPMTTVKETPTTLMVDGGFNFGHVVSHRVMNALIEKAENSMVAAASIRNQAHVGCLIDYTSMAARRGMIALMMTDGAWGPKFMAPFGGTAKRLGINPWSVAMPFDDGEYLGFDMTSGAVSSTKIKQAADLGEQVPQGWLADAQGNSTTDPHALRRGGSVLPSGGHKGYVLSFVIEALADVLSGMGFREDLSRPWPIIDGCFMTVFNVEAFRSLAEFTADLREMAKWVTTSPPAAGIDRVYYPGERSRIHRERSAAAVDIPDYQWESLLRTAAELGVGSTPTRIG